MSFAARLLPAKIARKLLASPAALHAGCPAGPAAHLHPGQQLPHSDKVHIRLGCRVVCAQWGQTGRASSGQTGRCPGGARLRLC